MIYTQETRKAMRTAYSAHKRQTDRSGVPYIFHPIHLAEKMETEDFVCVALLHDVPEDTHLTRKDLKLRGFKEEVIEAVVSLTKNDDENYDTYIKRLKENDLARIVKIEDLRHNLDRTRLKNVKPRDELRLSRYKEYLLFLLE